MAYPVRHFDPQTIYFLTSRTIQSRLLMAPSDKANELIGGILARAVRQCEIELFAYVFTSNHFHLMARAPSAIAMSKFMQRLQSNIAVKVGRLVDWRGRFFARRYSAEPVVDEGAQVERLGYILSHGVKEGLVSAVKQWPGLSGAQALLDGATPSPQTWRNWTRRWTLEVAEGIKNQSVLQGMSERGGVAEADTASVLVRALECGARPTRCAVDSEHRRHGTRGRAGAGARAHHCAGSARPASPHQARTSAQGSRVHQGALRSPRCEGTKLCSQVFARLLASGLPDASTYGSHCTASAHRLGVFSHESYEI